MSNVPPQAAAPSNSPSGMSDRAKRSLIRRVAKKTVEVAGLPGNIRQLLAALVGQPADDVVKITVATMTADRSVTAPLDDLTEIAEADAMEAGVLASTLERDQLKAVHSILSALGVELDTKNLPTNAGKAALSVASVAQQLEDHHRTTLDTVVAAAKKS